MSTMTMSRKKATQVKPAAVKPPAERKAIAVVIKGGPDWKAWLESLADHCRSDVAKVIDKALIGYAKSEGYDQEGHGDEKGERLRGLTLARRFCRSRSSWQTVRRSMSNILSGSLTPAVRRRPSWIRTMTRMSWIWRTSFASG